MEENKVIEVQNEETKEEIVVETKKTGILKKVGNGIKNNWKTIAVGAVALVAGIALGSRRSDDEDDIIDIEPAESEEATNTEE